MRKRSIWISLVLVASIGLSVSHGQTKKRQAKKKLEVRKVRKANKARNLLKAPLNRNHPMVKRVTAPKLPMQKSWPAVRKPWPRKWSS